MKNGKLVHGFYLVLVGLLVAFLANREIHFHRRMAYQAAVMVPIVHQLSAQHHRLREKIQHEHELYRLQDIFQRATRTDSLQTVLIAWLDSLQQTDNNQYRQTALHQYNALARELSIPDPDPMLRDQIQSGTTNTSRATLLGLTASALSASLSEQAQQLAKKISAYQTLDALIPYVKPEQPAIAGQPFRAEIFSFCYTTRRDSTSTPYVNGTAGKFERGQFQFQETADKSGQRRYLVRVADQNPFNGDTIMRQKTKEIRVW